MKKFKSVELLLNSASKSTKEELQAEFNEALAEYGVAGLVHSQILEMKKLCFECGSEPEFNIENTAYIQAFESKGLDIHFFLAA